MEIEIARQIGQVVRRRRKELGLTQSELAEDAHVDRSLIIRIESGEAKSLYPEKLLNVLHSLGLKMLLEPEDQQSTTQTNQPSPVKKAITASRTGKAKSGLTHVGTTKGGRIIVKTKPSASYKVRGVDGKLLLSAHTHKKKGK